MGHNSSQKQDAYTYGLFYSGICAAVKEADKDGNISFKRCKALVNEYLKIAESMRALILGADQEVSEQ
eukprot:CAMPEP_0116874068 /NCGR_PEP_ID=MMETSP0463-20121206/5460_1 /TAXON_ID=181622 /ORGANISM="Strombidinopsis sp, Strain SopsisLIS2011" /LENGTH=67 /DNA_ID=CAMNT_0004517203 /DNA_START=829 /DNA_END=1032 /DNA_ORIENTATION=-